MIPVYSILCKRYILKKNKKQTEIDSLVYSICIYKKYTVALHNAINKQTKKSAVHDTNAIHSIENGEKKTNVAKQLEILLNSLPTWIKENNLYVILSLTKLKIKEISSCRSSFNYDCPDTIPIVCYYTSFISGVVYPSEL